MLASLGRFLQGPPAPVLTALTLMQLLAMHVPMLLFGILLVSIAAAFLALARPLREAALLLALSGAAYALLAYLLTQDPAAALAPLAYLGAPLLLAGILRQSQSLALAILGGFAFGWLSAVVLGWLPAGIDASWGMQLEQAREAARAAGQPEPFPQVPVALLDRIGTELVMASMLLLFALMTLLARAWQSALQDEPFFGTEFRAMRYGRAADAAFLAIAALAWLLPETLMLGLALTLVIAFLFPASALMHRMARCLRYPMMVLAPYYVLLLTLQEMAPIAATLGAAADLLGLDRRLPHNPRPT